MFGTMDIGFFHGDEDPGLGVAAAFDLRRLNHAGWKVRERGCLTRIEHAGTPVYV